MIGSGNPPDEMSDKSKWSVWFHLLVSVALLLIPALLAFLFSKLLIDVIDGNTFFYSFERLLLEPFFYSSIGMILGIFLILYWLNYAGLMVFSITNKMTFILVRAVFTIILIVSFLGIVYFFSQQFVNMDENRSENAALTLRNALEQLPTQTAFYVVILAFVGACFLWRWWQYIRLGKEFLDFEKPCNGSQDLTPRDWWVARGLRKRALSLRTRSDLLLIGIILLLFSGMYLVLFILLEIQGTDAFRVRQIGFGVDFGQEIQDMVEGRYWIKTGEGETNVRTTKASARDVLQDVDKISGFSISMHDRSSQLGTVMAPLSDLSEWKRNEWVIAVAISSDGNTNFVMGDEGSFLVGANGAKEWTQLSYRLFDGHAVHGAISKEGNTHIVVGNQGSIRITADGGKNWTAPEGFSELTDERVTAVAVSSDGETILAGTEDGSIFIATDGGENWTQAGVKLENREEVTAVAVSGDGRVRVVAGQDGSAFVTTDGGENWARPSLKLEDGENVAAVSVSDDGSTVILGSLSGSASITADGGENWTRRDFRLGTQEEVAAVLLSSDGTVGVVAGEDGSAFVTEDRGENWTRRNFQMESGEWLETAALSNNGERLLLANRRQFASISRNLADGSRRETNLPVKRDETDMSVVYNSGNVVVIAGDKGSIFVSVDGGEYWEQLGLQLMEGESVTTVGGSIDGEILILGGSKGSVFLTADRGQSWSPPSFTLMEGESVTSASVSQDGKTGALGGSRGSVFLTTDAGENWERPGFQLAEDESVAAVVVSGDGRAGVVHAGGSSIHFAADLALTWRSLNLPMKIDELVQVVAVSNDGKDGVIAGNKGSVWLTTDGGQTWTPASFNLEDSERVTNLTFNVRSADRDDAIKDDRLPKEGDDQPAKGGSFPSGSFVIETNLGDSYLLRRYPELKNWATWSPARVLGAMNDVDALEQSPILKRIATNVANAASEQKDKGTGSGKDRWPFDELTIMRIVTSTILFFLVQLLVRLYQYSLRLASFWESRADAVLLNHSFVQEKSERFEDLVSALAPDGYDFKAMPRSPLDWLWRGRSRIPNIQP